jgi:hypothetical protein
MATYTPRANVELSVTLTLNEAEAKAIDALVGYGVDGFLKVFKAQLGEAYMRGNEDGLKSFFESSRHSLPGLLRRAEDARLVFRGTHNAVERKRDEPL